MSKKVKVSIGLKSDHTIAGEDLMLLREKTMQENISDEMLLEFLKLKDSCLKNRMALRSEVRKNKDIQMKLDEHNSKFETSYKLESIELANFEENEE